MWEKTLCNLLISYIYTFQQYILTRNLCWNLCTVMDCLWLDGNLSCFSTPGFVLNLTVTNNLTIWIPHAFPNLTGEYYCKMAMSTDYNNQHCQLVLKTGNSITFHAAILTAPFLCWLPDSLSVLFFFLLHNCQTYLYYMMKTLEGKTIGPVPVKYAFCYNSSVFDLKCVRVYVIRNISNVSFIFMFVNK